MAKTQLNPCTKRMVRIRLITFLVFPLGFRRPNLITGLSAGWWAPDYPLSTQEFVPDQRTGTYLFNQIPCNITFILQGRLIAPLFVWRFCSCSGRLVRIPGFFCVRGVLRIFIQRKLSNFSALLVLSLVNM